MVLPGDDLPPPAASEEESGERLPLIDLETLLARPPSWRKRLVQLALVLAVVMVALVALRGFSLSSPAPAGGPSVTGVAVTVQSNVNFGSLTINGSKVNGPLPQVMLLPARGTTVITLSAPPFRPQTCRFTDLTAPQDDPVHCSFAYQYTTPNSGSAPRGGFVVGVYLTPDDLPANQQSQVLAALSLPLGTPQQTIVHPGEYIATGYRYQAQITSQRGTTSLLARASFEPGLFPGPAGGPDCGVGICPWGTPPSRATALHLHAWSLFFTEALRWQFSDAAGVVRADVSMPSTDIVGVLLTEDAGTGWQIAQLNTILGTLRDTTCQAGIAALWFTLDSGDVTVLHDQGVEGCELSALVNGVNVGRYVWRFGVLLTADAQARASQPDLPVAPATEIAAVGG